MWLWDRGKAPQLSFFVKKTALQKYPFEIKALVTENPNSGLIEIAKKFDLPYHIVEYQNKDFQDWDKKIESDSFIL